MNDWYGVTAEDGTDEWHYSDLGDGVLWQEPGLWVFKYSPGPSAPWTEHRMESAGSLDQAKREAEKIMDRTDYLHARRIQPARKMEQKVADRRPGKDEIVVQAVGQPDKHGRMMFFAHWQDLTPPDAGGPTDGIRAQIYDVNLDDFMIRQHTQGRILRFIDHEPEWEPAHQTVSTEDLRNVVNLASEIEDRTETKPDRSTAFVRRSENVILASVTAGETTG